MATFGPPDIAVGGMTVVAPDASAFCSVASRSAGLVSFTVDGMEPEKVTVALEEQGFFIRHVEFPSANRISTGFYNTEDEIEAVAEAIGKLASA